MNAFYQLPKAIQWALSLFMAGVLILILGKWLLLAIQEPLAYLLAFFIIPICQFLATPLLTLTRVYDYLSPMLLVFGANEKTYDLHNGTSFDYLFVMYGTTPGINARNKMLRYYLSGLLQIIEKIETGKLPESVEIRGSSYFFSERTAKRLGFEVKATGEMEQLNLVLNVIDLFWMYSFVYGRMQLPNLRNVKTATTTGASLVQQKDYILQLYNYLNQEERVS